MASTGIVIRLSTVDKNTHLEANPASAPYFSASMAVVEPTGMPVSITAVAMGTASKQRYLSTIRVITGSSIRRMNVK